MGSYQVDLQPTSRFLLLPLKSSMMVSSNRTKHSYRNMNSMAMKI